MGSDTATLDALAHNIRRFDRLLLELTTDRINPLEESATITTADVAELKTQLAIILGNINGISERLDRLEQAHGDLVLQYHQGIYTRVEQLERQVLDMLTNTLPSSTDRISQLEHQVKDYVGRIEVTDR